jgi:opacity protein-like surface antigen
MKRTVLGVAMGLALIAGTANAQSVKPFSIGISGGLSAPTGDFGDAFKSGYNLSGMFELQPAGFPVALRLEGQFQKFDAKGGADANFRTLGALANVVYYIPSPGIVKPYFTGGLGLINGKMKTPLGDGDDTKFAYDLGAGVNFQLTGFTTFVEANWQSIQAEGGAIRQFPIRVGVKF